MATFNFAILDGGHRSPFDVKDLRDYIFILSGFEALRTIPLVSKLWASSFETTSDIWHKLTLRFTSPLILSLKPKDISFCQQFKDLYESEGTNFIVGCQHMYDILGSAYIYIERVDIVICKLISNSKVLGHILIEACRHDCVEVLDYIDKNYKPRRSGTEPLVNIIGRRMCTVKISRTEGALHGTLERSTLYNSMYCSALLCDSIRVLNWLYEKHNKILEPFGRSFRKAETLSPSQVESTSASFFKMAELKVSSLDLSKFVFIPRDFYILNLHSYWVFEDVYCRITSRDVYKFLENKGLVIINTMMFDAAALDNVEFVEFASTSIDVIGELSKYISLLCSYGSTKILDWLEQRGVCITFEDLLYGFKPEFKKWAIEKGYIAESFLRNI